MRRIWLKIINIFLVLVAIGFILWLLNKNVSYQGSFIIVMDFKKDQPMITRLGPGPRIKLENDYALILESPVYFDLRSLPWFKQAEVYLIFLEEGQKLEGIGGQVGEGWQYELQKPVVVIDEAGWQQAVFDFDLTKVYQQKNIRRFLISIQQTEEGGKLKIKALKIVLKR